MVVAVCWVIGYILKQTPKVPDWTIIYTVTLAATILVVLTTGINVDSVLQAILCSAVAVYDNQLVKQTAKAKEGNEQ
ncbi:hypothetical protein D3C76_1180230 [compost metagenome]|uniref:phage holin family protein n=1 Tax=Paenibacillus sp. B2(2019) TaxID=2607754 RepID=UPI000FB4DAF3|nr:phage holin family protein [Paenibacillus sp. B2(2019)]